MLQPQQHPIPRILFIYHLIVKRSIILRHINRAQHISQYSNIFINSPIFFFQCIMTMRNTFGTNHIIHQRSLNKSSIKFVIYRKKHLPVWSNPRRIYIPFRIYLIKHGHSNHVARRSKNGIGHQRLKKMITIKPIRIMMGQDSCNFSDIIILYQPRVTGDNSTVLMCFQITNLSFHRIRNQYVIPVGGINLVHT